MKKVIYIIILSLFQFEFKSVNSAIYYYSVKTENDWQIKKEANGIMVYERKVPNSNFKELKSVVYVNTSMQSIVALINDWESYPQWVYRCGKSTTLKKINDTTVVHYQNVTAPWPFENRDFIVVVKFSQNRRTKIVTIKSESVANYIPPVAKHVRITSFSACWTLVPLKNGDIQVNYQLLVDPGGNVPAWLVNKFAVEGPYETMVNFKEWIVKDKYKKAQIPFIKELI
jgi:ribosome-associated toxin RatA of RatAB toxin-antitoxin module